MRRMSKKKCNHYMLRLCDSNGNYQCDNENCCIYFQVKLKNIDKTCFCDDVK